ncbi:MAG: hypothetical protein GX605_10635 [Chloroflexi bacterium]|nr:hypothetical protein [Chloroflexota bacterium]
MPIDLTPTAITAAFQEQLARLRTEPGFQWGREHLDTEPDGQPLVRVAVGNVPLTYDLWEGLRNPAMVGLHPAGLQEVWEFHAYRTRRKVEAAGRATIFQIPQSWEAAQQRYRRAVLVSAMLPFQPELAAEYAALAAARETTSSARFSTMYFDQYHSLDRAINRLGMALMGPGQAVVPLDKDNEVALAREAVPLTRQGDAHGPRKDGNWPQKSLAVLLGLGQFGVHRLVFRDEVDGGEVRRFGGSVRSLVIFDAEEPITDGRADIVYPSSAWRAFLFALADFTNADTEVNRYRFCPHIPQDGQSCSRCIALCPSGALPNSSPTPSGRYVEGVAAQGHRFWEGRLQFDHLRCKDERDALRTIYPDWWCTRCQAVCMTLGARNPAAAARFAVRRAELTRLPTQP